MSDYIGSPLKRPAVYRSSEGVVYDEGNTVTVSSLCEFFYVEDSQGRVCYSLAEDCLGVFSESRVKFFFCAIGIYESKVYAHALHGN